MADSVGHNLKWYQQCRNDFLYPGFTCVASPSAGRMASLPLPLPSFDGCCDLDCCRSCVIGCAAGAGVAIWPARTPNC